jgi:hypothetical protein
MGVAIDRSGGQNYIQSMTNTDLLLKEIETMPEETAAQVLDFAMSLRSKHTQAQLMGTNNSTIPSIKDAYGIFKELKGMDTTIERDEEDRV